ncbi:UDP-3-O-acyl-N-acetylglucosamine deacetylase [Bdellovibrio sp. SKB1291214]|uniref:UDP-3-O-acyl-N-acetylglucosamine deacetylase n=1 Tax=Bdellovibrio sp. SKB1291214 TaxID=1732569 RepID=UPI000B51ABF9|nr:UDP-3-O-acyl-N-acetylglucosamine deacetylase [Bdellovibrio sp. SKB1291214]UYL07607.1 UDP-3-O-acyl-N-acetylglucosamine deacetylase [Bdellovibrio sp. SKB1291214]
MFLQKTIRKKTLVNGIGIHSGDPCTLTFRPAPPDTGVYFIRKDLPGSPSLKVTARNVQATSHQTTIGGEAFSVATIEHCLSALSALRIDNLFIELDGPEIPICDGSAGEFLKALLEVGIVEQDQPRKYCYITEPIYFSEGEKHAYVVPYHGLRVTATIDFPHPKIGKQTIDLDINEQSFGRDIASARTFGFLKDVEALQARGLAKGGSLDNCIVLDGEAVINPEGLRWADEFVRHKALDALGDLVTLEMPLMGHVVLYKAGHDVMNKLVKKIWDSPTSYRHVELGADISDEVQRFSGWTLDAR